MITQRLKYNPDGTARLEVFATPAAVPELMGLMEELKLRSTVKTEAPIHNLPERPREE